MHDRIYHILMAYLARNKASLTFKVKFIQQLFFQTCKNNLKLYYFSSQLEKLERSIWLIRLVVRSSDFTPLRT